MLIEIPDPDVILSIVVAFLGGLFALYVFTKLRPYFNTKKFNSSQSERLEYYERQLIDMKIRLDLLDLTNAPAYNDESKIPPHIVNSPLVEVRESPKNTITQRQSTRLPNMEHYDITTRVLQLITEKPMTSRDIQITLNRTREHTARLMKKLFQEGLVERNTKSKPFSYSISNSGKTKLMVANTNTLTV